METRPSPAQLVPIVAGYAGLLAVWDFEARPSLFLLLVGATFLALWWFWRSGVGVSLRTLLVVGLLARCFLVPVPLRLSDDAYRYVWDGRVALAGFDPYRTTPDDPALEPLRDDLWELVAHREVETVYPPLAIALFSLAAALPFEILAWKVVVAFFDLAACWLLWRIARRAGVATRHVVWFAWNPLVVIEGAGMGHVDAIGVCALLGGFHCLQSLSSRSDQPRSAPRPLLAGVLVSAGVLIKLVPLVLLPLFALRARSARFVVAAGGTLVVGLLPMLAPSAGPPPGLVRYGVSWEFNGPAFDPLWRAIDRVDADTEAKAALDAVKTRLARPRAIDGLYHYMYPQFLAKTILLVGLGWIVLVGLGVRSLLDATRWTLGGALLLNATCYPWYFLWIVPFAALAASPAWLILTLSLQASYLPRLFGWSQWPTAWVAVWAPFAIAGVVQWRRRARRGAG